MEVVGRWQLLRCVVEGRMEGQGKVLQPKHTSRLQLTIMNYSQGIMCKPTQNKNKINKTTMNLISCYFWVLQ